MKKIFSVGGATQDILLSYEGAQTVHLHTLKSETSYLIFEQGTKIDIPALSYATGGGATNAAVSFKRLGLQVKVFFKVGSDAAGTFVRAHLEEEGIDLTQSIIDANSTTAISIIIPSIEHNNVALCFRGANSMLTPDQFPLDQLDTVDALYVSPLSGHSGSLLHPLVTSAKKLNLLVTVNPSMSQIVRDIGHFTDCLRSINILVLNAHEAAHLSYALLKTDQRARPQKKGIYHQTSLLSQFLTIEERPFTLRDYFDMVLPLGPQIAVVTNGIDGVYVGTQDAVYYHPSLKTDAISAIGAGDAFGSTFAGCMLMNNNIEDSLIKGIVNASSVLRFIDAKTGLLQEKELEEQMHLVGKKHLVKVVR